MGNKQKFFSQLQKLYVGIDYFDHTIGKTSKFYPDFIFWLKDKKNGDLVIKFVDPKGGGYHHNAYDKAVGFETSFKKNSIPNSVKVFLHFYNPNKDMTRSVDSAYKKYWCHSFEDLFLSCLYSCYY